MKSTDKSTRTTKNLDLLISKVSENEILNLQAMMSVRGGDGEGDGGGNIIIIPPPPPPPVIQGTKKSTVKVVIKEHSSQII